MENHTISVQKPPPIISNHVNPNDLQQILNAPNGVIPSTNAVHQLLRNKIIQLQKDPKLARETKGMDFSNHMQISSQILQTLNLKRGYSILQQEAFVSSVTKFEIIKFCKDYGIVKTNDLTEDEIQRQAAIKRRQSLKRASSAIWSSKKHPTIQESKHKEKYDQIYYQMTEEFPRDLIKDKVILEDSQEENLKRPIYNRCATAQQCQESSFCDYTRMETGFDPTIDNPQLPPGRGLSGKNNNRDFRARELKFANTDFPERLLALKNKQVRAIVTDESADDWLAQSIGLTYDKFSKIKKTLKSHNQISKSKELRAAKAAESQCTSGRPQKASPKKAQVAPQIAGSNLDMSTLIQQARPINYENTVQEPDDLIPKKFTWIENPKSFATKCSHHSPVKKQSNKIPLSQLGQKIQKLVINQQSVIKQFEMQESKNKIKPLPTRAQKERRQLKVNLGPFQDKRIETQYMKETQKATKSYKNLRIAEDLRLCQAERTLPHKHDLALFKQQKEEIKRLQQENQERQQKNKGGVQYQARILKSKAVIPVKQSKHKKKEEVTEETLEQQESSLQQQYNDMTQAEWKRAQISQFTKAKTAMLSKSPQKSTKYKNVEIKKQVACVDRRGQGKDLIGSIEVYQQEKSRQEIFKQSKTAPNQSFYGIQSNTNAMSSNIKTLYGLDDKNKSLQDLSNSIKSQGKKGLSANKIIPSGTGSILARFMTTNRASSLTPTGQSPKHDGFKQLEESGLDRDFSVNWHQRLHDSSVLQGSSNQVDRGFQDLNLDLNEQSMMRIRSKEDVHHDLDWNPFRTGGECLHLSLAETESDYFTLNKSLKGQAINAQYSQKVMRVSQEQCFRQQKKNVFSVYQKQNKRLRHNQGSRLQLSSRSGIVSETKQCDKVQSDMNSSQFQSKMVFNKKSYDPKRVLEEIQKDNDEELLHPFVLLGKDNRVNVTEIVCEAIPPDPNLKKMKLDFAHADFWLLKGQEHSLKNELDSAIDSYRQSIRLEARTAKIHPTRSAQIRAMGTQAMHNLACAYELQQRFDMGKKWFEIALCINEDKFAWVEQDQFSKEGKKAPDTQQMRQQLLSYHGYALCQFKSGYSELAIEKLDIVIQDKLGVFSKIAAEDEMIQREKRGFKLEAISEIRANYRPSQGKKQSEQEIEEAIEESYIEVRAESLKKLVRRIEFGDNYHFFYLRSLCFRVLTRFDESCQDYETIRKAILLTKGKEITKSIFGMLMGPMEQNRKKILFYVDNFLDVLEKFSEQQDRLLLSNFYLDTAVNYFGEIKPGSKWIPKKINEVLEILSNLSFFKRFPRNRLREIMEELDLKIIASKKLIFFEPNKVYVVVSGSVQMQGHQANPLSPVTYANFGQGDIMNFLQDKSETFNSIETFFQAQVESEVAVFSKDYFKTLWQRDIMTEELRLQRSQVFCFPVFRNLSELLIMSLVTEFIEKRTYSQGTRIFPQSRYSPSHSYHRQYYDRRINKFEAAMKQKRLKKQKQKQRDQQWSPSRKLGTEQSEQHTIGEPASFMNSPGLPRGLKQSKDFEDSQESLSSDYHACCNEVTMWEPGFYLIVSGQCSVRNLDDDFSIKELNSSEFFGESEIFKSVGFEFFGAIFADTDVEFMFIPQATFKKIPLFEQLIIKEYAESREVIKQLAYEYSQRYGIDIQEYNSFYG